MKSTTKAIVAAGLSLWLAHKAGSQTLTKLDSLEIFFRKLDVSAHPITKQMKDEPFMRCKNDFLSKPMPFDEAKTMLAGASGVKISLCNFNLPDPGNLCNAKKFYSFNMVPVVFPQEFLEAFGDTVLNVVGNEVFRSHAFDSTDGRMPALASYVLSAGNCTDAQDAIRLISEFAMQNIYPDTTSHVEYGTSLKELYRGGYGVTHHHLNSISVLGSTGVCVDYANLVSDLLNSVGIPARPVDLVANGLKPSIMRSAQFLSEVVESVGHTIVEARLPSGVSYFEVTPTIYSDGSIDFTPYTVPDPANYVKHLLELNDSEAGANIFRAAVFGAQPSGRFESLPRILPFLERRPNGAHLLSIAMSRDPEFKRQVVDLIDALGKDYGIYFYDAFFERRKEKTRK